MTIILGPWWPSPFLKCLYSLHSGEGGICRINCGGSVQIGDCTCRQIHIAPLRLPALGYGDAINLDEQMQIRLTAIDREGGGQCTLLALPDGMVARNSRPSNIPDRSRVSLMASDLGMREWPGARKIAASEGMAKSFG